MIIHERYKPVTVAVDSVYPFPAGLASIGGFLAQTAGTISITNQAGTDILVDFPVSAGIYYPLPFWMGEGSEGSFSTGGGASGLLGV